METSVRPPVSRPLTIRKTACRVGPASPKELFCAEALAGRCLRAPSPARGSRKDRPHAQECGLQAWGSPKGAWTSAALGLSEVWRPWSCLLAHGQEGIPGAAQGCFLPVGRLLASWPLLPEPPLPRLLMPFLYLNWPLVSAGRKPAEASHRRARVPTLQPVLPASGSGWGSSEAGGPQKASLQLVKVYKRKRTMAFKVIFKATWPKNVRRFL